MSTTPDPTTPAAPAPDPRDAQIAQLKAQLAEATKAADSKPSFGSKLGAVAKKFGASLMAALSTPEAVKTEKYLAVIALTRIAILLPGAAILIDLLVKALGGPGVTP
jgi:hypothetical protein